jgi:hypothetical protein
MKNLKNLGKVLNKQEQKSINGGKRLCNMLEVSQQTCTSNSDCRAWIGAACSFASGSQQGFCVCL